MIYSIKSTFWPRDNVYRNDKECSWHYMVKSSSFQMCCHQIKFGYLVRNNNSLVGTMMWCDVSGQSLVKTNKSWWQYLSICCCGGNEALDTSMNTKLMQRALQEKEIGLWQRYVTVVLRITCEYSWSSLPEQMDASSSYVLIVPSRDLAVHLS